MSSQKRFKVQPGLSTLPDFEFGADSIPLKEWVFLGRPAETVATKRILFDVAGEHVVAIVGKRGSGKSFTLGSLAEALVTKRGDDSTLASHKRRSAVVLIDTLNIFPFTEVPLDPDSPLPLIRRQHKLLAGWPVDIEPLDVSVWVPGGQHWSGTLPHYRDLVISCSDLDASDWATMLSLDIAKDPQGQLLADAHAAVVAHDPRYSPQDLIATLESDGDFLSVYHAETVRSVKRQLMGLTRDGLFARDGTPMTELVRPGSLAVIMTNQLDDGIRSVLVEVLAKKLLALRSRAAFAMKQLAFNDKLSAAERAPIEAAAQAAIPPVWLMIDEAQNIVPPTGRNGASEALVKLVREGRNSGVSCVVTTQQPSAIDQRVLAQVDTLVVHQLVTQPDLDAVRRNLKSNEPTEIRYGNDRLSFDETVRILGVGQCLVSSTDAPRWFICTARPRVAAHGGIGASTAAV